jgi:hypothetical protein
MNETVYSGARAGNPEEHDGLRARLDELLDMVAEVYIQKPRSSLTESNEFYVRAVRCLQIDGTSLWKVQRLNQCLNHKGKWETPPNRIFFPGHFERCRFATMDEAIEAGRRKIKAEEEGK